MSKILLVIAIAFGLGAVWWWAIFGLSQELTLASYVTVSALGLVGIVAALSELEL